MLVALNGCALPFLAMIDAAERETDSENGASAGATESPESPGSGLGPQMVTVHSASFTIAWDAPNSPDSEVDGYELFYREHGTEDWLLLTELNGVSDDTVQFEITTSELSDGPGHYDFAVRSLGPDNEASEYHTSLCDTATPERGWYVNWEYAS